MTPAFYAVARQVRHTTLYASFPESNFPRQLCGALAAQIRGSSVEVDVLNLSSRAALETIAHVGLNHSFGTMEDLDAPPAPIAKALKDLV